MEAEIAKKGVETTTDGVMGFVKLLEGKSEKLISILDDISEDTMKYHVVLESCKFKHPITVLECDYHIALSNYQEQICKDRYEVFLFAKMEYFAIEAPNIDK